MLLRNDDSDDPDDSDINELGKLHETGGETSSEKSENKVQDGPGLRHLQAKGTAGLEKAHLSNLATHEKSRLLQRL